jgi:sulfofructosephosphate aldolase
LKSVALPPALRALADETGTFAMLAIDQRESLRTMMTDPVVGRAADDNGLVRFKTAAAELLTPLATAVLLDRRYGLPAVAVARCPVILAADELIQSPGGPVTASRLDREVTPELVAEVGAAALKMLIAWTPETRHATVELAIEFMALCRAARVPGIVEGVVRPADIDEWDDSRRDEAIVQAAGELAAARPDLYKGEVPSYGRASPASMTRVSRQITAALDSPWVILSSGVAAADFPAAVTACRAGGASGFLAGRAVWSDAFTAPDVRHFLATESRARLSRLAVAARAPL